MSYTFSLSRRSLPVRCLCLLLAVLVLWCFFMVPRAGAVATEAATVAYAGALIGTILVGAGVVFSSHGDMQAVGAAMYKSWIKSSNAIGSTISAIASWALEHGEAVAKGALRVGKDVYQGIVDAFNSICSNGVITVPGVPDSAVSFTSNDKLSEYIVNPDLRPPFYFYYTDFDSDGNSVVFLYYVHFILTADSLIAHVSCEPKGAEMKLITYKWSFPSAPVSYSVSFGCSGFDNLLMVNVRLQDGTYSGWNKIRSDLPLARDDRPVAVSASVRMSVSGDLAYPSDNYLVKMPDIPSVDTATGTVTFPSDAAYTKDAVSVPYPVDAEGVKVPDIPYDKVVDQSTGKTLDDADTGTDTKPGEGTGTETGSGVSGLIGTIIGLLKNFFDSPSDFKLDMDGFRNLAIADKFPFCIPFDMVDSVKQFAATAADYQFRIKFDTQYFSVDHTVDLTPIAVPLAFFRYIVCVWFVWVLMSRTHDLMKW